MKIYPNSRLSSLTIIKIAKQIDGVQERGEKHGIF